MKDQGSTTADILLAGEFPRVAKLVTVTGGNYQRGAVLGKQDGKYILATSEIKPEAILAENVNAAEEDLEAVVYLTGEFNSLALTFDAGLTVADIEDDCRAKSIFIKSNQGA